MKQNKFLALVTLALVLLLYQSYSKTILRRSNLGIQPTYDNYSATTEGSMQMGSSAGLSGKIGLPVMPPERDYTPQSGVDNRLVIQESSLSLLVRDVIETRNKILEHTRSLNGYMVNSNTSNPQDSPTGNITVRVPANKLQESLDYFNSLAIKVVSENLIGTDVTDQFVDIEKRISQIERTMARLEDILQQATEISDITNITQQLLYYQNEIDSLKGQQESLEKNAELAKLTIYLSTDEIALPYTPNETFRPQVIFKLAVRSLVATLRDLGELTIWLGVYSVIWIPALLLYIFVRKWRKNKNSN